MVVPPKHPKMIIFSKENPWKLLGKTTILGHPHIDVIRESFLWEHGSVESKNPTGPEGMNIQMLGNMNGGMQNMLLGPSF